MMKESKEVLKQRILNGAIALFIERGVEKVSTRDVTEALGLSRSHIYYYFSDWQALCIAALSHYLESDLAAFSASITDRTPAEKLNALIDNYLPDSPDAVWQLYSSLWQMAAHNAAFADLAESLTLKWDRFITKIINEGKAAGTFGDVDTVRITRQLSALLNGYSDNLLIKFTPEKRSEAVTDINAFIEQIR
ncbi:TetR/AcrR family transcriptional regulator [Pantoea sp. FN0302]|uniref:TetR/AcrR family transcriptional regulator n=1 Tax=unclassified Pantoea TaxID=2630326 RepID=UPI003CF4346E